MGYVTSNHRDIVLGILRAAIKTFSCDNQNLLVHDQNILSPLFQICAGPDRLEILRAELLRVKLRKCRRF